MMKHQPRGWLPDLIVDQVQSLDTLMLTRTHSCTKYSLLYLVGNKQRALTRCHSEPWEPSTIRAHLAGPVHKPVPTLDGFPTRALALLWSEKSVLKTWVAAPWLCGNPTCEHANTPVCNRSRVSHVSNLWGVKAGRRPTPRDRRWNTVGATFLLFVSQRENRQRFVCERLIKREKESNKKSDDWSI